MVIELTVPAKSFTPNLTFCFYKCIFIIDIFIFANFQLKSLRQNHLKNLRFD